jgi:steroid delta-isomerase
MQTDVDRLVHEYLASLEAADADRVIALFTPDGIVESPLYGTMPAAEFYPVLFADTASSRLTLRTTMTGSTEGRTIVSFWFDFDWILSTGKPAPFTVVDVAELNEAASSRDCTSSMTPIRSGMPSTPPASAGTDPEQRVKSQR